MDDLQRAVLDRRLRRGLELWRQAGKLLLDRGELPHQENLDIRKAGGGLHRPDHDLAGGVVAAHGVKRYPRHALYPAGYAFAATTLRPR